MHIYFKRISEIDLPLLAEWLNRPHVAEWWGGDATLESVLSTYLPRLDDASEAVPYFAYVGTEPIGYIQSYVAVEGDDGWWAGQHDPGVRGIDQFLADAGRLGQGLGTRMIRDFARLLFQDSAVSKLQADPAPSNARAIRCYEKAGFRQAGRISTPDGAAILMLLDRPNAP
jgi:aminoglycoside 6'-N-acetyltransferase-1b